MKLKTLDLIAYGPFTDRTLDFSAGPRSFHLVYGPNESGKSTCLRAIHSLLFGFPSRTSDDFIHKYAKLRVGATIVGPDGKTLPVVRRKNGKVKLFGADDSTPVDESELNRLLGHIDENTFTNRFGLSHDQLVVGGQAILDSKGELGGILFAAGAGVGQLQAVQNQLEEDRKRIFGVRTKNTTINALLNELKEKRKELREIQTLPAEYRELKDRLAAAQSRADELSQQMLDNRRRSEQLRSFQKTIEVVPVWRRERSRLQEIKDVPELNEDFAARRREASATQQHLEKSVAELKTALSDLQEKLQSTSVDSAILQYEQEIVSLFQEISARAVAARDQEENLWRRVKTINRHFREHLQDLELDVAADAPTEVIDDVINKLHVSDAARVRIEELASEYKQLREKERDEQERWETLKKRLSDIDDELEQTPFAGDSRMIESVLNDIGAPDAIVAPANERRVECEELTAECGRLLTQLKLSDLEPDDASKLQVPAVEEVDERETLLETCSRQHETASVNLERREEQRREIIATLQRLKSEHRLPTEDELTESRKTRDQTVSQIESELEKPRVGVKRLIELRKQIFSADQIVDSIRSHHQQVAQRSAAESELAAIEQEIEREKARVDQCKLDLDDAREKWQTLWQGCHIEIGGPRAMRTWLATYQLFLDRFQSLRQCQSRRDAAESKIRRVTNRLVSAIELARSSLPVTVGSSEPNMGDLSELDFDSVYDRALQLKAEQSDAARNLDQCRRKRQELLDELPRAEARYQASVQKREQWDTQWHCATESVAGQNEQSPGVINARLQKINKIREEKRERDILMGRIHSIDSDTASFVARVENLIEVLDIELSTDLDPSQKADELHRCLQATKAAKTQHERLVHQRDEIDSKLSEMSQSLSLATAQLADLCAEAQVETVDELPAMEALSSERRKVLEEYRAAEKQLTMIAGTEPLEEFAKQVESQDPAELAIELAQVESKLAELEPQSRSAQQEWGAIKQELAEVDGSDRAAELNQSIQFLTGRIEREADEFAKLKVAEMILQRSIEHYRKENESPVLKIACEAFQRLTCRRYEGLRPEYDDNGKSTLKGVMRSSDGDETLVAVDHMSLGTADALYLAMRYASLKHQLSNGTPIPVVIDDCLIQLDDERTIAALRLLSELSETTQVILFTHHEHLVALAKAHLADNEVHFHRLGDQDDESEIHPEPSSVEEREPSSQVGLF